MDWRLLLLALSLALAPALSRPEPPQAPSAPAQAVLRLGGFVVEPMLTGGPDAPIDGILPRFIRREIAPNTRIQLEWQPPTSYARAIQSLRDGSLDIVLLELQETPHPPDIGEFAWHYLDAVPQLAVNVSSPLTEVAHLEDLGGLRISWVNGAPMPPELATVPIHWLKTSARDWQSVNLRMLVLGRSDGAYFANPYSPTHVARRSKLAIRLLPLPIRPSHFTMLYSLHADKALIEEFDQLAAKAFKGGRFRSLLDSGSID